MQSKLSASNLIGLPAEYSQGDKFSLTGQIAEIGYELPKDINGARISILNEDDEQIAQYLIPHDVDGKQTFDWDGYRVIETDTARNFRLIDPPAGAERGTTFEFQLPRNTDSANMVIRDATGTIVREEALTVNERKQSFTWDGQGATNPDDPLADLPEGSYSYQIVPLPAEGGAALSGKPTVFEAMPQGTYKVRIDLDYKPGKDTNDGVASYYLKSRIMGVAVKDGEVTLNMETGEKLKFEDVTKVGI